LTLGFPNETLFICSNIQATTANGVYIYISVDTIFQIMISLIVANKEDTEPMVLVPLFVRDVSYKDRGFSNKMKKG